MISAEQIRRGESVPDSHPLRVANPDSFRKAGWSEDLGCQVWKLKTNFMVYADNEEELPDDGPDALKAEISYPPGYKPRAAKWWLVWQPTDENYNDIDFPPQKAIGIFLEQVSLYGIFDRAARIAGQEPEKFHKLFQSCDSFTLACQRAMKECEDEIRYRNLSAALDGTWEPITFNGRVVTWVPKIDIKVLSRAADVHLEEYRIANGAKPAGQSVETGVLVVPPPVTREEWEKAVPLVKLPDAPK